MMYPGLMSAQVIGWNLLNFAVIIRNSSILLLILFVIFLYLSSKVTFLIAIKVMLTDRVTIGKDALTSLYFSDIMIRKKRTTARKFSK